MAAAKEESFVLAVFRPNWTPAGAGLTDAVHAHVTHAYVLHLTMTEALLGTPGRSKPAVREGQEVCGPPAKSTEWF